MHKLGQKPGRQLGQKPRQKPRQKLIGYKPVRMKLAEYISQRPASGGKNALKPLSVWAMLQELAVCRWLRSSATPVAVIKHVGGNVEVTHQHH